MFLRPFWEKYQEMYETDDPSLKVGFVETINIVLLL